MRKRPERNTSYVECRWCEKRMIALPTGSGFYCGHCDRPCYLKACPVCKPKNTEKEPKQ